jgi:tRNA1Val (adenine37-N6)-methyltransferase
LHNRNPAANSILDIGTGTGLLSLMIAQNTTGGIDAIEIEEAAFIQAKQNIEQSPWRERMNILNEDALVFNPEKKYDCILSNPPFFEGDLKSGNQKKDAAKHDTKLTLEQLLQVIDRHLSPAGCFAVLLPYHRLDYFIDLAKTVRFYLNQILLVQHTEAHPFFRGMLVFSKTDSPIEKQVMAIKNTTGNYTAAFIELMLPYYLHL